MRSWKSFILQVSRSRAWRLSISGSILVEILLNPSSQRAAPHAVTPGQFTIVPGLWLWLRAPVLGEPGRRRIIFLLLLSFSLIGRVHRVVLGRCLLFHQKDSVVPWRLWMPGAYVIDPLCQLPLGRGSLHSQWRLPTEVSRCTVSWPPEEIESKGNVRRALERAVVTCVVSLPLTRRRAGRRRHTWCPRGRRIC